MSVTSYPCVQISKEATNDHSPKALAAVQHLLLNVKFIELRFCTGLAALKIFDLMSILTVLHWLSSSEKSPKQCQVHRTSVCTGLAALKNLLRNVKFIELLSCTGAVDHITRIAHRFFASLEQAQACLAKVYIVPLSI